MICCSGNLHNGSLRVIRNGIGITETGIIELSGIKGVWPLSIYEEKDEDVILLSFPDETKYCYKHKM